MFKFAHMSDIHLGAHREPILQKLELVAFTHAMNRCIELKVDFILISGDFFHVGIPDLGIVNEALKKMLEVKNAEIPIYVIYGSHDYTPTATSVIDILDTAGVINKIVKWRMTGGKVKLDFVTDRKTGAKLAGISARKMGLESKYYEVLDKESLEHEDGFKIFAFHSGIAEFKPTYLAEMETLPISYLPKGFNYYAGGHIHEKGEFNLPGYEKVVFPGPLFTGYGRDLEVTVKGAKRGFYIVTFDDKVRHVEFEEVKKFEGLFYEFDATGLNSLQAAKELQQKLDNLEVKNKILVLKIKGELLGGKTSDLNLSDIKTKLIERGAQYVHINRSGLSSREYSANIVIGEDISTVEINLLKENIGSVRVTHDTLKGENGVAIAIELLKILRQETKTNESKKDYKERMVENGLETLGIKEMFEAQ
ncbi:MAG TPA: DNA repair exonuclease [Nitrososphaerales archaeon]